MMAVPTINMTKREAATVPPSPRELEVLHHASYGLSNAEIARTMFISVETVKVHVRNARAKLGAHSRGHACCEAFRRGLIQ